MADLQRTVAIIFNAVDETGGTLESIGSNIEAFSSNAQNVTGPLADLGASVLTANAAIVALGATLVGVAVNEAGKFQAAINEIGTLFGGTSEQIDAFGASVLAYSGTSVKSIEDINGAIYSAVSAGISYSDSLAFMAEAEKLSVAGKADLNSTTVALVSTLNAFGASTDEAAKYSDLFFQTVKLGQTTLPELSNSLAQVTGVASAAGIDFEALSAAIAALTAYGLPTSQAITGIKAAISNIIKPTSEADDAAKLLGISFDSGALASKGFAGVLDEVYTATNGNVGEMGKFFGSVEALNVALTLGGDVSGKYAGSIQGMADSAGATSKAFETMSENADLMAVRLENSVKATLITAGTPLLDEWAAILGAVGEMFSGLRVSFDSDTFAPLFSSLETLLADLGQYFEKIAEALPAALEKVDLTGLAAAFGTLGDSAASIFDGVDLTKPEGLADAIQFVVDSVESLLLVGAGILAQWGEWSSEIAGVVSSFNGLTEAEKQATGETLGIAQQLDLLFSAAGKVGSGIEAMGLAFEAIASVQLAKFITGATSASAAMAAIQTASAGAGVALAGATLTGGLVAAAAAAGYGVGTVLNEGLNKVVEVLGGGTGGLGGLIYDLTHDTDDLGTASNAAAPGLVSVADAAKKVSEASTSAADGNGTLSKSFGSLEEQSAHLADLYKLGSTALGDLASKQFEAASKAEFLAAAQANLAKPTEATASAMTSAAEAYKTAAFASGDAAAASEIIRAEYEKLHPAADKVNEKLTTSSGVMETLASKTDLTNKDLIELAKLTSDAEVKLESLASNERIKVIESSVKLNVAEIEADTKVATAIIEGIGQTYTADVGLIGDLMAQVTDGYSFADRTRIAMAKESSERVEELHYAQMELIGAQIDYMRAKTDAAGQGNPLVSIQADGLKPHLEAFMWEILSAIQVKMAYDGSDMLVGGCSL